MNFLIFAKIFASLAQLVEQLIRNEQVVGSSPIGGSKNFINSYTSGYCNNSLNHRPESFMYLVSV